MGRIAVKILNGKKLCSKCKEEKTISNFYPDKTLKFDYSIFAIKFAKSIKK